MSKLWKTAPTKLLKAVKPVVHIVFVPLIIIIALQQEPELSVWQVVNPFAAPAEPPQLQ